MYAIIIVTEQKPFAFDYLTKRVYAEAGKMRAANPGGTMKSKRGVSADTLVRDLKAGLTNSEFMKKYSLGSDALCRVFKKLLAARLFPEDRLARRILELEAAGQVDLRRTPRCYPRDGIPVSDLMDITTEHAITDLSAKGFRVEGLQVTRGEARKFVVLADRVSDQRAFSLMAQCRWVQSDPAENNLAAGFKITSMSKEAEAELNRLMESMAG